MEVQFKMKIRKVSIKDDPLDCCVCGSNFNLWRIQGKTICTECLKTFFSLEMSLEQQKKFLDILNETYSAREI
jgi:protein-arginine kinase activator protein McsA